MAPNFWPDDLVDDNLSSPQRLLRDASEELEEKTGGEVQGRLQHLGKTSGRSVHAFVLYAPDIEYEYELARLEVPPDLYPLRLHASIMNPSTRDIEDEEGLVRALTTLFSHQKTRRIVAGLAAQAKDT